MAHRRHRVFSVMWPNGASEAPCFFGACTRFKNATFGFGPLPLSRPTCKCSLLSWKTWPSLFLCVKELPTRRLGGSERGFHWCLHRYYKLLSLRLKPFQSRLEPFQSRLGRVFSRLTWVLVAMTLSKNGMECVCCVYLIIFRCACGNDLFSNCDILRSCCRGVVFAGMIRLNPRNVVLAKSIQNGSVAHLDALIEAWCRYVSALMDLRLSLFVTRANSTRWIEVSIHTKQT